MRVRRRGQLGSETVGRLPGAFSRPERDFVEACVMIKQLQPEEESP